MGILVDMSRAKAKFSDPAYQWGALSNFSGQVQFDMHSFEIEFGASFDPDPTRGVGGASQEPELWRIGIVQNVLFEHIHLEYEGGKIFKTAFKDAAPDYKEGTMSKPFYGDPEATPGRLKQRPAADIWLTAQGYGELLSPSSASGVAITNRPDFFNLWDEPTGVSRLRLPDGSWIKRVEKVISFQVWFVVTTKIEVKGQVKDQVEILAHVPPFSLIFYLEADVPKVKPNRPAWVPDYVYTIYGEDGLFDPVKINRRIKVSSIGTGPTVKPVPGKSKINPVMAGPAAAERANAFLKSNNLLP